MYLHTFYFVTFLFYFSSNVPRERMQEDTFDSRSAHSIGIVENPLYSEESDMGMPSFAKLSAKEKADEVRFSSSVGPYTTSSIEYVQC